LVDDSFVADFEAPSADDLERVDVLRFGTAVVPLPAPRFGELLARVAVLRGVVRFAPERAPARFAAMRPVLAKNMPGGAGNPSSGARWRPETRHGDPTHWDISTGA
jgi:hypothetical protein